MAPKITIEKAEVCRPLGDRYNHKEKKWEKVPRCKNWKNAAKCSDCVNIVRGLK